MIGNDDPGSLRRALPIDSGSLQAIFQWNYFSLAIVETPSSPPKREILLILRFFQRIQDWRSETTLGVMNNRQRIIIPEYLASNFSLLQQLYSPNPAKHLSAFPTDDKSHQTWINPYHLDRDFFLAQTWPPSLVWTWVLHPSAFPYAIFDAWEAKSKRSPCPFSDHLKKQQGKVVEGSCFHVFMLWNKKKPVECTFSCSRG